MRPEEIRKQVKRTLFQPFRVHISDGAYYDVPHPDSLLVSHTQVVIGVYPDRDDMPESTVLCDPLHVTRIELMPPKKSTNRRKRKP
jgi:hypothetical protein